MAGIYSQGGSAGHRYAGWLSEVEAKNFQFGGKVFNGSPSAIYVGSNLVWFAPGLTGATQRAILGAFGQTDGKAVIKATNAYLNQLAASDMDKATALAGFINEDPMMVCSLGLQPELTVLPKMPWRKLLTDGTAYINTGFQYSSDLTFEIQASSCKAGVHNGGSSISRPAIFLQPSIGGLTYAIFLGSWSATPAIGADYLICQLTSSKVRVNAPDGTNKFEANRPSAISKNMYVLASNGDNGGAYIIGGDVQVAHFKNNSKEVQWVPFNSRTKGACLLDLLSGEIRENAASSGAFSFGYTGNWTPSTP